MQFSFLRLVSAWDRLRTSFLFLPSLMTAVSIALSFSLVWVDEAMVNIPPRAVHKFPKATSLRVALHSSPCRTGQEEYVR